MLAAIVELRRLRARIGAEAVIQMGNNYIPGEGGSFSAQIDRAIRAAAARWPTIRIVDWASVIAAHPSYAYDMLHLTPPGRLAMSRLIASAVRAD